ncbi:MAG TPA: hypothetical protein VGA55_07420, partial [Bacteroidota bacterium]
VSFAVLTVIVTNALGVLPEESHSDLYNNRAFHNPYSESRRFSRASDVHRFTKQFGIQKITIRVARCVDSAFISDYLVQAKNHSVLPIGPK